MWVVSCTFTKKYYKKRYHKNLAATVACFLFSAWSRFNKAVAISVKPFGANWIVDHFVNIITAKITCFSFIYMISLTAAEVKCICFFFMHSSNCVLQFLLYWLDAKENAFHHMPVYMN